MKFVAAFRVLVLSLLVVAAGTVQPRTIQLKEVTQGKWADVINRMSGVPSTKLVLLDSFAKNDLQNADVQDYTAQIIQDTFANFNNYTPGSKSKLIRIYKKLLTSHLLRDDQKAFLQNTVLATVAPMVQQQPAQAEAVAINNDVVEMHNTLAQNGVAPSDIALLQTTSVSAPDPQVMTLPAVTPMTMEPIALPMVQQERPVSVLTQSIPVAQVIPAPAPVVMAPTQQVAPPVLMGSDPRTWSPSAAIPSAPVVSESTVNAITQNVQMSTAGKAVALTNLINTATAPVDVKTSSVVAQAVQDLYNTQATSDAAHVVGLLNAVTQKPVLTQEQNNYVRSTLMPVAAQQLAANPAASVPTVAAPQVDQVAAQQGVAMPVSNPGVVRAMVPGVIPMATQQIVQAVPAAVVGQQIASAPVYHDLEETMKNLYRNMQAAQGQSFDSATQGAFGAALVEAFNGVVELQSYMSQLLTAAQDTPLLNDAQHNYVRDTMMPNLDQVSSAKPTKTLDQMASDTTKKKLKKGKNKNHTVAGTSVKNKKGKNKNHTIAGTSVKNKKGKNKAHAAGAMPTHGKKKKNKKLKGAAHAPVAAVHNAGATDTSAAAATA